MVGNVVCVDVIYCIGSVMITVKCFISFKDRIKIDVTCKPISFPIPYSQPAWPYSSACPSAPPWRPWGTYIQLACILRNQSRRKTNFFFKISTSPSLLRSLPFTADLNSSSCSGGNDRLAFPGPLPSMVKPLLLLVLLLPSAPVPLELDDWVAGAVSFDLDGFCQ